MSSHLGHIFYLCRAEVCPTTSRHFCRFCVPNPQPDRSPPGRCRSGCIPGWAGPWIEHPRYWGSLAACMNGLSSRQKYTHSNEAAALTGSDYLSAERTSGHNTAAWPLTYALWLSSTPGQILQASPRGGAQDVVILAALERDLTANLRNVKRQEELLFLNIYPSLSPSLTPSPCSTVCSIYAHYCQTAAKNISNLCQKKRELWSNLLLNNNKSTFILRRASCQA